MSEREEFAFVRMVLKRLALPNVVFFRPKTDSLHLPPETNDGTSYGPAIASLVDENGLTYTGTELVDLGLQAPALLAAFDAQAARIAEMESPAHRALVVREFEIEVDRGYAEDMTATSMSEVRERILARWEAAAKEGA